MRLLICFFLVFLTGCHLSTGRVEFYDLVRDHRQLTNETNASVISSIKDELASRNDLTPEQLKAVQNLIERLEFISRQSDVIHDYVLETKVDQDLISKLIQLRWNNASNKGGSP